MHQCLVLFILDGRVFALFSFCVTVHVLVQDVKARWAGQDSLQTEVIGNLADLVPNSSFFASGWNRVVPDLTCDILLLSMAYI